MFINVNQKSVENPFFCNIRITPFNQKSLFHLVSEFKGGSTRVITTFMLPLFHMLLYSDKSFKNLKVYHYNINY